MVAPLNQMLPKKGTSMKRKTMVASILKPQGRCSRSVSQSNLSVYEKILQGLGAETEDRVFKAVMN